MRGLAVGGLFQCPGKQCVTGAPGLFIRYEPD